MSEQKRSPEIKRHGSMEISESLKDQKRLWKIQFYGRSLIGLILFLGLIGFFGRGPISQRNETKNLLSTEYQRFIYRDTTVDFKITVAAGAVINEKIRIWFDSAYLNDVEIETITPEPNRREFIDGRAVFEFESKNKIQAAQITFDIQPKKTGPIGGTVGLEPSTEILFKQWVWP